MKKRSVHIVNTRVMGSRSVCNCRKKDLIYSVTATVKDFYGRLFMPETWCRSCARIARWI